jgi:hypothetical protein
MDIKRKDIIDIKGKSITIIGLARSGVAAAKLPKTWFKSIYQ